MHLYIRHTILARAEVSKGPVKMPALCSQNLKPDHELVLVRTPDYERHQFPFCVFPDLQEYHTSDLFIRHPDPAKADLWRTTSRLDDVIVFLNGEKTNPISMEQHVIAANREVTGCLVAGAQRFQAALIVELGQTEAALTVSERAAMIEKLWPSIQAANSESPAHARIARCHILFTTPKKPMLRAGKGTIQRVGTLMLYAPELEALYTDAERLAQATGGIAAGPGSVDDAGETVILTGSTGQLGSYILDALLKNPSVRHIHCLNRNERARETQHGRMATYGLTLLANQKFRVSFWTAHLSRGDLGLQRGILKQLQQTTILIIHNAWTVNFNHSLAFFEPHLQGVVSLSNFTARSPQSPRLFFLTSISSTTGHKTESSLTPETVITTTTTTTPALNGYANSKYIAEHLLDRAAQQQQHSKNNLALLGGALDEILPVIARELAARSDVNELEIIPLREWVQRDRLDIETAGRGKDRKKLEETELQLLLARHPAIKLLGLFEGLIGQTESEDALETVRTAEVSRRLQEVEGVQPQWVRQWIVEWLN
ncbi:hypothetical protein BO86DRAFT_411457 [Aspergillus japonicus CBS 114.51]|uniref:Thioester reductase (TE) domain-containing protein n=1 Tax=Aspergillus japonicus CBS 114.51 TaxID=1448312 RepID=A0A8T8WV19_ASPJA|nr:hypothetical protein BO86DRAFT_411457 [Aspergillus japonicus CBS 114.51]RAH79633.1 hypothetical protein BO86DRAFT_411457 [Aspergillus japonicus CBS 114.51]